MTEKAKGIVTLIEKKTSAAGKEYFFATIGGVRMLFFDKKIEDCIDKEIEVEYTEKKDEKGITYFGNFPGQAKTGGAPMKRGSSPEELKQKAIDMKLRTKTMIFSYAKDLVIAFKHGPTGDKAMTAEEITKEMDVYITFMLNKVANNIKELEG
uniref:Uncharacterized protein n=1 Tax=viral metagenome TaxID=1070528 RepID=A0A6M3J0N8_9ZZZZ